MPTPKPWDTSTYPGSEAYHATMTATFVELARRKRYTDMAVSMSDDRQARAFFEAELSLLEKRMKQLEPRGTGRPGEECER